MITDKETIYGKWLKGIVIEAHKAADGQVRSVVIQTSYSNTPYTRPVAKVVVLEARKVNPTKEDEIMTISSDLPNDNARKTGITKNNHGRQNITASEAAKMKKDALELRLTALPKTNNNDENKTYFVNHHREDTSNYSKVNQVSATNTSTLRNLNGWINPHIATQRTWNAFSSSNNIYNTANLYKRITCFACSDEHRLFQCDKFKRMSIEDRMALVERHGICQRCLKKHRYICNFNRRCGIDGCNIKHSRLLHMKPLTGNTINKYRTNSISWSSWLGNVTLTAIGIYLTEQAIKFIELKGF